ncbi:glycosyltransferase [Flavobacteriaceae bacterium Ap0902]|nr:glycosyltransferase [Flavobacteriaceae bacterium Ap0902]
MPTPKKVLLLTYYWPPAGGAGVQRWLKMSKHIAKHCDLTIYRPENAHYPIKDESLEAEVPENARIISHSIREPYAIAEMLNPANKTYKKGHIEDEKEQSILSKASLWLRANLFIPDARAWWIMPSFNYLNQYLKENPQDIIITTGPPHSVHVIGLRLKLENPDLKWIADFRDPWTQIDYFSKLPLRDSALKKHQKLEKEVLSHADKVVTVSPSWAEELEVLGGKDVEVVYNGFDRENFKSHIPPDDKFTMTYVGSLNDDRNPRNLWNVLNDLCENETFRLNFKLNLIGNISRHVKSEINQFDNLKDQVAFINYIPHQQAIHQLQKSHILLLLINKTENEKGIIPGKFFEYLAAERKILCLGSEGIDIQKLIEKTNAGIFAEREDEEKIKETLLIWHQKFKSGLLNQVRSQQCSPYSRKEAAYKFTRMIQNI